MGSSICVRRASKWMAVSKLKAKLLSRSGILWAAGNPAFVMKTYIFTILLIGVLTAKVFAAENLKLNPHLDYSSDSHDGPLITGDNIQGGLVAGKPNYIIIFGEACYNSKRQARRTVELYGKYRDKVNFVVIDLDTNHSAEHQV